jgi:rhodanese-related sulfurtransferase
MDEDWEIGPDELWACLDGEDGPDGDGALRVVDIRSPDAFARGHIPGSENLPFGELPDRVEQLDGADRVVTVCPHGKASLQAARLVAAYEGVDRAESLAGGLEAWPHALERGGDADETDARGGVDAPF